MGMFITLVGAALTLVINFTFIPKYGMYACAWATLAAYASMMVLSYVLGQKYYKVPYATKKLVSYMAVMMLLFFGEQLVKHFTDALFIRLIAGVFFMNLFIRLVYKVEKKELARLPVIGKYIKV